MQIQSPASLTATANSTSLAIKYPNCKSLAELHQHQPQFAINAIKEQIAKRGIFAEYEKLPTPNATIQNIIRSRESNPHSGRMNVFKNNLLKQQAAGVPAEKAQQAALIETITPLAAMLYECARDYLGLRQSLEIDAVFVECAREWHNQPKYKEFSRAEVRDAFNLAAQNKLQIYNNFSVALFYTILDEYLETRRVIVAAIEKINSEIEANQQLADEKEQQRREAIRKEFMQNAANEIQQATKQNTRWRKRGKLRIHDAYCNKSILDELIAREVISADAPKGWNDFLKKFATEEVDRYFYTFGEFLQDNRDIKNYNQLLEGFKIGKSFGWATNLKEIEFSGNITATDIEVATANRAAFIERAKIEFIRFLYCGVLADYTNPNHIIAQTKPVYTLSDAQAQSTNWVEFCSVSLSADETALVVGLIKSDTTIAELALTDEQLNELLLSELKAKPAARYSAVSLTSFLISCIANYAQRLEQEKLESENNAQIEALKNLAQLE